MQRTDKAFIRVWHENKMVFPKAYTLVQEVGRPLKIRFVLNRNVIKTINYMMPIIYEGKVFYERDIVSAERNGSPIIGRIVFSSRSCSYVVETASGSCHFCECKNVEIRGNDLESPDLLTTLSEASTKPKLPKEDLQISSPVPFDKNNVTIYTDGACIRNPGPGGAAFIIRSGDLIKKGAFNMGEETTNNKCEMMAAIKALEALPEDGCTVHLHSDSKYMLSGFTEGYIKKWVSNGWKTAKGDNVKNQDFWQRLNELNKKHNINWIWVKGHNGNSDNEECDIMAKETAEGKLVKTY